ncbi:hypothetical protein HOLleu_39518 [Holothuria leucospilota]|uniref:Uncharacterized protein n=1 Tax=Holothuria leucospilota TaxID=206669 RepID=A0A9Q1BE54_HOLLE|nr:hypothetical protein HOLleu_39518 [Holothuria leucospilota]
MWSRAHMPVPAKHLHPLDYGWKETSSGQYIPNWYEGAPLPDTLFQEEKPDLDDVMDEQDLMQKLRYVMLTLIRT